jgi:hypothetical protein
MNSDNISCIRSDFASTHPFFPAPLTLASTTETAFSFANTTGPAIISVPLQTAIVGSSTPVDPNANPAVLTGNLGRPAAGYRGAPPYFSSGSFDGRSFLMRVCVKTVVTTGATAGGASMTINPYLGTSATIGSDTKLFAPTVINIPINQTAVSVSTVIELNLTWDSGTAKVFGEAWANHGVSFAQNSVYTARGTLATTTGIPAATLSTLNFLCSAVWSVNAPTTATHTLTEFSISQL